MNIDFLDIETSPMIVESWGLWKQNHSYKSIRQHRSILCAVWKRRGNDYVEYTDQIKFKPNEIDDTEVCNNLYHALQDTDVLVMHNGNKFDLPIIRAHLIHRGFPPLPPIKVIDTLTLVRKYFKFVSNRLDDVGEFLGVGRKIPTNYELWQRVMAGEKAAIEEMSKYCIQDVLLLEDVFDVIEPYLVNEVKRNQILTPEDPCPHCGTVEKQSRGWGYNLATKYRRFQCMGCHSWLRGKNEKK